MLRIAISILIGVWFFLSAKKVGKNPWGWAVVGIASYQVIVFLLGQILRIFLPGMISAFGRGIYFWRMMSIFTFVSIGIGIAGSAVVRLILMSSYKNKSRVGDADEKKADDAAGGFDDQLIKPTQKLEAGHFRESKRVGFEEILPKTDGAYYCMLGAYSGAVRLSENANGSLVEDVWADAADTILKYAEAVGIADKLQGDYSKIDEVIAENCPERDLLLFQTGEIIIALAFPQNLPDEKDLDMLELGMKNLGISQATNLLKPIRLLSIKKSTRDPNDVSVAVWNALSHTIAFLNNKNKEGSPSQTKKDMTMGDLMETSLGKYSHLKPSEKYSKLEPNGVFLGYWSSPFLTIANTVSGDPVVITELLSAAAKEMVPYVKKLNLPLDVITHGYNSIFQEIEKNYSNKVASAYRIGFLLGGASCPNPRFRTKGEYNAFLTELRKAGMSHLSELKVLDKAIRSEKNESIAQAGAETLYALANALQERK